MERGLNCFFIFRSFPEGALYPAFWVVETGTTPTSSLKFLLNILFGLLLAAMFLTDAYLLFSVRTELLYADCFLLLSRFIFDRYFNCNYAMSDYGVEATSWANLLAGIMPPPFCFLSIIYLCSTGNLWRSFFVISLYTLPPYWLN